MTSHKQDTPQDELVDRVDELIEQTAFNLKTSPDEMFDRGVKINARQGILDLIETEASRRERAARRDEANVFLHRISYEVVHCTQPSKRGLRRAMTVTTNRITELKGGDR